MTVTPNPQNAACQVIGAQLFRQLESETPRAVLGLFDLAARFYTRQWIPDEYMTYTVPWKLFLELEAEAVDGIFASPVWNNLITG